MLNYVSSQWPFEEDVVVTCLSEEILRGAEEFQTCVGVYPVWLPSLNLLEAAAWALDISVGRPPIIGSSEVGKGLEDPEASVALGSVGHRRPRTGLISADSSYKM